MDDWLEIRTLGGLSVLRNGTPVDDFDQRKVPALLVYLACTERPQPRETLAELFWEERPQSQSLANLRVALSNLRKTVGPFVEITRDRAQMHPRNGWRLDAVAFETGLDSAGRDIAQLTRAVMLYQGDFLDGFYIDSQGFEDWALLERERLRFRAVEALDRLIDGDLREHNYVDGVTQATRLLQLDPLREKTYRQLMQLFALSGERATALTTYRTCCQMLETEFSAYPAAETVALFERIQACEPVIAGEYASGPPVVLQVDPRAPDIPPPRPRHNLPPQPTSFVGREVELARIMAQLRAPRCRLLTLVGPGGIGKTRMALVAAERLCNDFAQGVCWVPLAALTAAGDLAQTVASAVGLDFVRQGRDMEQELLHFLHGKELLLVLDNFEHLLDGVDLVSRILAAAPGITMLITSRQSLNLGWEWLFEVRGLPHPVGGANGTVEDYSAVQLFVERARRVKPDFRLATVRDSVIRICQRVEGLPLGIEIAAAWVRVLPCEAIADELLALELPQRDVPERHRSLQTLFDYTWRHLTPAEQDVFKGLSVFHGSFTGEAAQAVTGASFTQLVALVHKSLLRCDCANRRYSVHELLRQYAAEQLGAVPANEAAAHRRHSAYYCSFLAAQYQDVRKGEAGAVLRDLDNVLAAWHWAVAHGDLVLVMQALYSLLGVFERRLMETLGRRTFRSCGETLIRALPPDEDHGVAIAQVLAVEAAYTSDLARGRVLAVDSLARVYATDDRQAQAFVELYTAYNFDADLREDHLRRSVALYTALGDRYGMAKSRLELGSFLFRERMQLDESLVEVEAALRLHRELGNPHGILSAQLNIGNVLSSQYHFDRARQCFEEALVIAEAFDPPNMQMIASCLNNIAYLGIMSGADLAEAEALARQAVAIRREYGNPHDLWIVLDTLATLHYERGDYASAEAAFRECAAIGDSIPDGPPGRYAGTHARLGLIALATERIPEAYAHFARGLASTLERESPVAVVEIMVDIALLFAHDGRKARALDLLGFTLPRPAIDKLVLEEGELRAELEAEFGASAITAAMARAHDLDPFVLAREVLAELARR